MSGSQQPALVLCAAGRDRVLPAGAPPILRATRMAGQRTPAELVGKYGLHSQAMRDLLTSYLAQRAAELDYASLVQHGQHAMRPVLARPGATPPGHLLAAPGDPRLPRPGKSGSGRSGTKTGG